MLSIPFREHVQHITLWRNLRNRNYHLNTLNVLTSEISSKAFRISTYEHTCPCTYPHETHRAILVWRFSLHLPNLSYLSLIPPTFVSHKNRRLKQQHFKMPQLCDHTLSTTWKLSEINHTKAQHFFFLYNCLSLLYDSRLVWDVIHY